MSDNEELRRLAEAATPGPWEVQTFDERTEEEPHAVIVDRVGLGRLIARLANPDLNYEADAAYIASVSPDVTISNLDQIAALEQDKKEIFVAHIEAVTKLEAALAAAERCSTCGGDPNSHPSKLLCVCGDGTRKGEVMGLRDAVAAAEQREAKLREALGVLLDKLDAADWFREHGIDQPQCWGKDRTCENLGNWFLPDREGIFCADCRNAIRGN